MRWRVSSFLCCIFVLAISAVGWAEPTAYEQPFTPPKRWALVVGASDYKHLGKLDYAADDAKAFAKTLVDRFSFQPDTVDLITDAADSPQKPDAATIKAALARQISDKRLDKGDLFIFYFAGHGVGTTQGDFILPTDATRETETKVGEPVREIVDMFVQAGLKNVIVIVDACRAGDENNTFGTELQELGKKANIAVILGCSPGGRSYEYPRLRHGVFTNFLIKSLQDRDLCSPESGSLWASKVADDVRDKVKAYTERDYPEAPQTPERWTDATRDVMLGVFFSKGALAKGESKFLAEAKKLDGDSYVQALDQYANLSYQKHQLGAAIEVYKTLESLNKLSPSSRYMFGMCLQEDGRFGEAEREFGLVGQQNESPLYKQLAIVFSPSRKIGPGQRKEAAQAAWKLSRQPWVGNILWSSLQIYASQLDVSEFLREFVELPDLDARNRYFYKGAYAMNLRKWDEALKLYDLAARSPGDLPQPDVIESMRYVCLTYAGNTDLLVKDLKKWADDPNQGAQWSLLLAAYYDETGQEDAKMKAIQTALTRKVEPGDLLDALRLSGMRYPEVTDAIHRRAAEFPYSWKALVADQWSTGFGKGLDESQALVRNALKYCDDEFSVFYEYFRILDRQLDALLASGDIDPTLYAQFQLMCSAIMAHSANELGYDPLVWSLFTKFELGSQKYEQFLTIAEKGLGKELDAGTLDPKLHVYLLFAALAMGDSDRVEQIWKLGQMHPTDRLDGGFIRAMYLTLEGNASKASIVLPPGEPSAVFRPVVAAFRAYLDVAAGKKVDLESLAKASKEDVFAMQMIALSYAKLGEWDKAEPLLRQYALQGGMSLVFLGSKAAETYFDRLIETKRFAEANNLAFSVMTLGFGDPLFRRVHFGPKVGVDQFAGKTSFEAFLSFSPLDRLDGRFELTVSPSGSVDVQGSFEDHAMTGHGKIDGYGNAVVTVKIGVKEWRLTGKVAPHATYASDPNFASMATLFMLIDGNGQSLYLCGHMKK